MRTFFTHDDPVVPVHHPRVLIETAVAQGAERSALLEGSGVSEAMLTAPQTRISYHAYALLVRNALKLTKNPALGIDVGLNTRFGQMGVLGLLLMNSATIGDALQQTVAHARELAPAWQLTFRVEGTSLFLRATETIPFEPYLAFATEMFLAALDAQVRLLYGGPAPVRSLSFRYSQPSYVQRYRELHDVPLHFDAPHTEIEADVAVLSSKIAFADPATARLASEYLAQHAAPAPVAEGLREHVKRLIAGAHAQPPDLATLARRLQTSTRSLRRALQSVGTSYHSLLDETRRERALEIASSTRLSFEQIAQQLGFSNVRSFRRAFKRWTGRTPAAYRGDKDKTGSEL